MPVQLHVTLPSRAAPAGRPWLKQRSCVLPVCCSPVFAPKQLNSIIPLSRRGESPQQSVAAAQARGCEFFFLARAKTGCIASSGSFADHHHHHHHHGLYERSRCAKGEFCVMQDCDDGYFRLSVNVCVQHCRVTACTVCLLGREAAVAGSMVKFQN